MFLCDAKGDKGPSEDPLDRARELREEADRLLPQLCGARVIPVSGLTGAHLDKLMEAIVGTDAVWNMGISTGRLNRWLRPAVDAPPPPAVSGRLKIRYITQPKARPRFFVLFGNSVEDIPESYKRYLVNGLRQTFGLYGVAIRLSLRSGGENPYAPKKRRG
jgi:GTP-binding protein